MTDFRDILYFYPLQEQFARNLLFVIKEFRFCHLRKNIVCK